MYRYGLAGRGQWWKTWMVWGVVAVFLIKCAILAKRPDGMAGKLLATGLKAWQKRRS